ncbi:MAG: 4-hydroxy-3-methylbut-2-enyl diphosphate reductase, partial [Gammaproteobacteria bacterium]|nr:4-hydroxy-3-methylbut-2-enyl diphosphate reductase [Gammaproteobacteria bacterium]
NSNRLKEVAERIGTEAYLIDDETEINKEWLTGKNNIGLTAGASAPAELVENVIARLREWGVTAVTNQDGKEENIIFSLPKELQLSTPSKV